MSGCDMDLAVSENRRMYPLHCLLPQPIRRRVKALKKLQLRTLQLQAQFYQELHRLDSRYQYQLSENYTKRCNIVSGRQEPSEEDCEMSEGYESPVDDDHPGLVELREKLSINREVEAGAPGIPEFWLTVLKNNQLTADMIYPHDEPVLKHLIDIKVTLRDSHPMSFSLHFVFSQNPFFTNKTLVKEYEMECEVDPSSPWTFEGPEVIKTSGTIIDWFSGMDVTQTTVKKKQRHKTNHGKVRTVTKVVRNMSFFNFFQPMSASENSSPLSCSSFLFLDFEIGTFIREKLVPRAVLYFTGEALEDDLSDKSDTSREASDNPQSLEDMPKPL